MLKIKWLGQSGYEISDGKAKLYIDPYLSDSANRVAGTPRLRPVPVKPEKLKADAIICTHRHIDHADCDSIALMDKKITVFAPDDCRETLEKAGVLRYTVFNEGDSYAVGDMTVTATFAEHTVPAVGVLLNHGGETLYFSGDTFCSKRLESVKCDYMFVCINGRLGNMNVCDAVKLVKAIKPRIAVPNHYDMFESNSCDPNEFVSRIENGFIMEFNREYEVVDGCLI